MTHVTMRLFVSAACGLWLGIAGAAVAENQPVVVELFTSQGCSSCPAADEFLMHLAQEPDVIALSLHVDYWDYIGWKDTFAKPQFTSRQKAYAKAANSRMIYTPQIIINGVEQVEGNDPEHVLAAVRARIGQDSGISLRLIRNGDTVQVKIESVKPLPRAAHVHLLRYLPKAEVGIGRGENAGMQVTYTNIVTDWRLLGDWTGEQPLDLLAPALGQEPVVVIVQDDGPGAVLAAARVN